MRTLGVSNVNFPTFERLWNESTVKPGVVQNRFYNRTGYDRDLRVFCQEHDVAYQGFWTITGNRNVVSSQVVAEIAGPFGKPRSPCITGPSCSSGVVVLDGTEVDGPHARGPTWTTEFELDAADVEAIDGALS